MQSPHIVELVEQNFREVLESSMQQPVLIHFWAPSIPESTQVIESLQSLANQYNGAFTLALLNCEEQQMIAGQFGVQALPTIALFVNGQPVDGLGGPQELAAIKQMLAKHLPSQDELSFNQATQLLGEQNFDQALTVLKTLSEEGQSKPEVKLALASCYLSSQQADIAETLLSNIPLEYQDGHYKTLMSQLELLKEAANSPELQALEVKHQENPDDLSVLIELAKNYHQVGRDEEALEKLWQPLDSDLHVFDGEVKAAFMEILTALGQSNPLTGQYRRKLYSKLY